MKSLLWALVVLVPLAAERPFEFEGAVEQTAMVAMRDGVKLATSVHRPARAGAPVEGRFPVIVYRTPYNRSGLARESVYFVRHGYVVVTQDVRGRFGSEGIFEPFLNEGPDGYDTIEWAAGQPWSTGKVGTAGGSYLAWDQFQASIQRPPHLVAMWAEVGGSNFYQEYGHPGGVPNLGWANWLARSAQTSQQAEKNPAARDAIASALKDTAGWMRLHPESREAIFRPFPGYLKNYRDFYAHTSFDDYWKHPAFYVEPHYGRMADVPVFFISGWYDYFLPGTLRNFQALSRTQKSPKWLLVGPWPHGTGAADCGDAAFGETARVNKQAMAVEWFDHWLKGRPLQTQGDWKIRLFVMGGGEGGRTPAGLLRHGGQWRQAASWPPSGTRPLRFYVRDGGALTASRPGAAEKPAAYLFDPDNPVPTLGGKFLGCAKSQVCSPTQPACSDSQPLDRRPDVLSFATEPLAKPVEIAGSVQASLWVSSEAPDTDFTAKLVDVSADGFALILADGRIRMRYRNGFAREELMKPRRPYQVTIDLGATANLFASGHRIRLDISSSNFPAADPNPNTGEPAGRWTRRVKTTNTLLRDAAHPSYVELPGWPR